MTRNEGLDSFLFCRHITKDIIKTPAVTTHAYEICKYDVIYHYHQQGDG